MNDMQFIKKQQTPREATERQRDFFNDLVASRDWDDQVGQLPPEWQELFLSNVPPNSTKLAMTDISKFIDLLKGCERKGRMSSDKPILAINDANKLAGTAAEARKEYIQAELVREPLADGFYRSRSDGNVYKVYVTQKGHQVAKKLVVHHKGEEQAEVEFVYVGKKPLHTLSNADRLTLEEAVEFGKLYGRCMICNRTLTNELSIALGIGPICGDREFGGEFRFMVRNMKGLPASAADYIDVEFDVVGETTEDKKARLQAQLALLEAEIG